MNGKSAAGSLTIVSAAVVLLAQIAQLAGYAISEDDQQALVTLINSGVTLAITIVSIIGAVGAIWGRVKASKPITSILPPSPPKDAGATG